MSSMELLQPEALCGVRVSQGGPVRYVGAGGLTLSAGELVVIAHAGGEALATVVIGAGQIVEHASDLAIWGHVLRMATPAEARELGRRASAQTRLAERARETPGLANIPIADAWLEACESRLVLVLARTLERGDALARELTLHLGIPVSLYAANPAGGIRAISGAAGAGLPPDGAAWLLPPDAPAAVQDARDAAARSSASDFIARLFPPADNWPPPRPPRRRTRNEPSMDE